MSVPPFIEDRLGQEIAVGDWIAYGVGRGYIDFALVLEIKEGKPQAYYGYDAAHRWVKQGEKPTFQLVIKSPSNHGKSRIEAARRHFVKVPTQPEGAEFGKGI